MIRKILQLASYVLAIATTILGALSLVVFLNLKTELLKLVNITDYNTFIEFDNAFKSKYIVFGAFTVCSLLAIVCLLIIVVGKYEAVKFIYVEKQQPEWQPSSAASKQEQSNSERLRLIVESFNKNIEASLHNNSPQNARSNVHQIFNAICNATSAVAGICYMPTSDGLSFSQISTFAVLSDNFKDKNFTINSGLLGQVAKDLQYKVFDNVPSNYLNIETSVGSLLPETLLIYPFSDVNNQCKMLVELAFLLEIDESLLKALSEINHQIAGKIVPLEAQL